jgi:hypothetical protein
MVRLGAKRGRSQTVVEEKMVRQHRRAHLIGGATVFGIAFASVTAFAQSYHYPIGRNVDDGGPVPGAVNPNPPTYNYAAPQQSAYHYPIGRNVDDGGRVPEPAAITTTMVVRHTRYHHTRSKSASR